MNLPMFENSLGDRDFLLTASALALAVVLVKALASGVVVGGANLGTLDPAIVAALLTPTFTAYTVKRVAIAGQEASK